MYRNSVFIFKIERREEKGVPVGLRDTAAASGKGGDDMDSSKL
jgi:hypothetical protein